MKTLDTALAFDRSEIAKFRLHCVELFISQGWSAFYQAFPQVGRRSVYRWKRSCLNSGQKLSSLFPHSTRPHWVRQMQIPATILGFLRTMRTKYLLDGVELVFSGIYYYFLFGYYNSPEPVGVVQLEPSVREFLPAEKDELAGLFRDKDRSAGAGPEKTFWFFKEDATTAGAVGRFLASAYYAESTQCDPRTRELGEDLLKWARQYGLSLGFDQGIPVSLCVGGRTVDLHQMVYDPSEPTRSFFYGWSKDPLTAILTLALDLPHEFDRFYQMAENSLANLAKMFFAREHASLSTGDCLVLRRRLSDWKLELASLSTYRALPLRPSDYLFVDASRRQVNPALPDCL